MIEVRSDVSWRRNGAYGEPFWVVRFTTDEATTDMYWDTPRDLVAIVFPEHWNNIAVFDPADLSDEFRGAHYWEAAIAAIDDDRTRVGLPPHYPAMRGK